ncbi:MAG: Polyadenylate-binding protein 2, variant 2 [Marteilia pararefringens]
MVAAGFEASSSSLNGANHTESNNLQEEMDFEDEDLGAPNAASNSNAARQPTSQSAADDTAMLMDLDNFLYSVLLYKANDKFTKKVFVSETVIDVKFSPRISATLNKLSTITTLTRGRPAMVEFSNCNAASIKQKLEADSRSIFVNQVEYSSTAKQLQEHFNGCGTVNRITIMKNHLGHPKGCAYIEFESPESVSLAMALDNSLFNGRGIQVAPKRTNKPGMKAKHFLPTSSFGRGRGRGGRGRARRPYHYY